jgi:hypothetical protein
MVGVSVKIDHEYLKGLLVAFEESDRPVTNIRELKRKALITMSINLYSI